MARMQVAQLSCLDITGELPDTNQEAEAWCSLVPRLLVWGQFLPIPCPHLLQSLAERLQGSTRPDCGGNGNTCSQ